MNGFYYKDDSRIYGDNIHYSDTGCDAGIECDPDRLYVGTYMYIHTTDLYYMYEVPSDTFPQLYISDKICSNDYILKTKPLSLFSQLSSWVLAAAYLDTGAGLNFSNDSFTTLTPAAAATAINITDLNDTMLLLNDTISTTSSLTFTLSFYDDNIADEYENPIEIVEFCDIDSGLIDSCLAPNYTYAPTIDIVTAAPTVFPTDPTVAPSLPTNEPTIPTYEPSIPTYDPTAPTYSPTSPTLEPTNNPTSPTSEPTYSPTDSGCPVACDSNPCDCTINGGEDPFCRICHSNGCNECQAGYFKKNYNYPCISCDDTFGKGCKFCQDFNGCGQCDENNGFIRRYCDSCNLWICTPQCYQFTEMEFTNQDIIIDEFENKFIADIYLSYEDIGCTDASHLAQVKLYLFFKHNDISNLVIKLEHDGVSVTLQNCALFSNCVDSHNENVLFTSDTSDTNDFVCDNCQVSTSSSMDSLGINGIYSPNESLDAFKNTHASGHWKLIIEDSRLGAQSMVPWLYEYSLHVCPQW